jgi:hypothetical protein
LQFTSYYIEQRRLRESKEKDYDTEDCVEKCCSIYRPFLIPPRTTFTELIFVIVFGTLYTCLMTLIIHPAYMNDLMTDSYDFCQQLTLVTVLFSSYSFIS